MSDLNNQVTSPERYTLKRVRDDISKDNVIGFLNLLSGTSIKQDQEVRFSFANIFQNVSQSSLYVSTENRKESVERGENPGLFLYKSDLAFLFYDTVNLFIPNLDKYKEQDGYQELSSLVIYCGNSDKRFEINSGDDEYLNDLLTDRVIRVSKLLLLILEEEVDDEDEDNEKDEDKDDKDLNIAIPEDDEEKSSTPRTAEEEPPSDSDQDIVQEEIPDEPLTTKNILFSQELRNQAAKFTSIALSQLEQHHGLPPGTLANSREIQEVLSQKTLGFFLTTIGDGKHNDLLAPETRLQLIREYVWLVQNDFRTTALISSHLTTVLKENSDPKLKEQIENALNEAESGTGKSVSELVSQIAENPELGGVLSIFKSDKLASDQKDYLAKEASDLLSKELKRIGVHSDKVLLSQKNVTNVIDTWIAQGLPLQLLEYIDEGRFRLIFGDEVPYNPGFLETLEDIWIARRSILGKKTGQILLHNEAVFATQEALALLDKKSGELSEKQSDGVFRDAVASPTKQILVGSKEAPIKDGEELVELIHDKKTVTNSQKREIFLKQVWGTKDVETKQEILILLGYGEAGSEVIKNISEDQGFYPKEIGLHDMAPLLGGAAFYDQDQQNNFDSQIVPSSGVLQSPLANVNRFGKKTKGLGKKLKRGVKGIRSRLSKKAAKKAAEKAAEAGLSKAATTAAGTVNPALGVLAKLATTKKGRKVLIAVGGLGLGSLIIPLTTVGGWIGSTIGAIAGGIFGGPGGAVAGGIGGGWTGYGIQKWFGELFPGKEGVGSTMPIAGSPEALAADALRAGKAVEAAQAAQGTAATALQGGTFIGQTITTIGGQAVLGTIAATAGGVIIMQNLAFGSLLANFPVVTPLSTTSGLIPGKESEFVTIEKRAFIAGCPENKCENPSFPIKVEYTLTIKPKGNYTIQVLDAIDTMKVNHSDKAWEEKEGKKPPTIPERVKGLSDFEELYEEMIIEPGDSVVISYSETLDSNYNHSSVLNTFDLKIFAKDPQTGVEGTDNAITGEVVYIGDYSQGAGCWPASGTITQLPGGSYSHSRVDAFDIANSEGTPIFAPFSGEACPGNLDPGYGNHVVLRANEGNFVFGHFRSLNISTCKQVTAGELLGAMGNTGNSSGPHLHFGMLGSSPSSGALPSLMPDGASVKVNDPVRTCYE
jgi:hypothetical protein